MPGIWDNSSKASRGENTLVSYQDHKTLDDFPNESVAKILVSLGPKLNESYRRDMAIV